MFEQNKDKKKKGILFVRKYEKHLTSLNNPNNVSSIIEILFFHFSNGQSFVCFFLR